MRTRCCASMSGGQGRKECTAAAPGDRRRSTPALGGRSGQAATRHGFGIDPAERPAATAEVRAQVQRMTASDVFASSPQLVRVSSVRRRGRAARARRAAQGLHHRRRGAAARHELRSADRSDRARRGDAAAPRDRALLCGPGADDPVIIELPRGGYAPRISWRAEPAVTATRSPSRRRDRAPPGNGMPTLRVAPFVVRRHAGYARDRGRDARQQDRRGLRAVRSRSTSWWRRRRTRGTRR